MHYIIEEPLRYCTRREWMLAVGAIPLELGALAAVGRQGSGDRRDDAADDPPAMGPPPTLPDKASFPDLSGTYLNAAARRPRSSGSTDLVKRTISGQAGEPGGFRPNPDRVRTHFAELIDAEKEEIAFVPSTQIGESFIASPPP